MSKYNVLETFKETNHGGIVYKKGDTYPKEGQKTSKKRIEELTTDKNKYKRPFLEEVKEDEGQKKDDKPKEENKEKATKTKDKKDKK